MCIVSLVKTQDGFILTHNRDESIHREASADLMDFTIRNYSFQYPKDLQSDGTWILAGNKRVGCVLNGEFNTHIPQPPYRMSRGKLLFQWMEYDSNHTFANEFDWTNIEPVSLLLIDIENDEYSYMVWNGKELYQEDARHKNPFVLLSSTLYSHELKEEKKMSFLKLLSENPNKNDLLHWHFDHRLLLNRPYEHIQMVSQTQVVFHHDEVEMTYQKLV